MKRLFYTLVTWLELALYAPHPEMSDETNECILHVARDAFWSNLTARDFD